MKKFEDLLSQVSKPEVRVDSFRRDLRRSLLDAHPNRFQGSFNYKAAFAFSSAFSLILAGAMGLFVFHPDVPGQIHEALFQGPAPLHAGGEEGGDPVPWMKQDPGMGTGVRQETAALPLVNNLLWEQLPKADEEMVRRWAEREFNAKSVTIEPLERPAMYAVSRYRLDNKKTVQVYTLLSGREAIRYVRY